VQEGGQRDRGRENKPGAGAAGVALTTPLGQLQPVTHSLTPHPPQGRYVHEATQRLPIIGDGDTGYGNALNVKRTVKGYAAAGFAGVRALGECCAAAC
jgi:hypothetical protein